MTIRHHVLAATAAAFLPIAGEAAGIGAFSEFFVFGDSLSDPGNVFDLALGAPASPIPGFYDKGQLTDGDTWATQLGADFASGNNFAFGAARAVSSGPFDVTLPIGTVPIDVPDLPEQIAAFASALTSGALTTGWNALAAVGIGGNDLRDALSTADPAVGIAAAIGSITAGVGSLLSLGVQHVVVLGLPDLGLIPEVTTQGPAASAVATSATFQFNGALRTALATFFPTKVSYFDTFGLFQEITANPAPFGFANIEDACIDFLLVGAATGCDEFVFYDNLHPTEAAHRILAERFAASVPAIPLPAASLLLVSGLGLAALRRRTAKVVTSM